jgi:hypothetical protein
MVIVFEHRCFTASPYFLADSRSDFALIRSSSSPFADFNALQEIAVASLHTT